MVNNLLSLAKTGVIKSTGAKPKLPTTIPNLTDNMLDVYRIPLKYLYFNDENGRIATQIKREYGALNPTTDEVNSEYNNKIAKFIEEDNPTALKKTKKSIQEKEQQVYGYVLQDGRIIDGNRRYTALRQIQKEKDSLQYFEAVILPFTYDAKADRSQIKHLELAIQMGTEEKLQYDPVDLAVDVYQTIVQDNLMGSMDYAKEADIKLKEIKAKIATVELMQEFLKFINAPEDAYYIVKDVKLYNPLYELAKKFKTHFPDKGPEYEQTKITAFTLLAKNILTGGDTVREVRDYVKNIVLSGVNTSYNEAVEDIVEDFRDKLDESPIQSATEYRKRINESVQELRAANEVYTTMVSKQNRSKNVENFVSSIKEMEETLREIKRGDGLSGNLKFSSFNKEQLSTVRDALIQIKIISSELIEVYEDEL